LSTFALEGSDAARTGGLISLGLRYSDLALLALALPAFLLAGWPMVGYAALAAAWLAQEGTPVVLVEAEPVPKTDWRASTFHAATLELLELIGITAPMHDEGLVVPVYHFRDRRAGLVRPAGERALGAGRSHLRRRARRTAPGPARGRPRPDRGCAPQRRR
jgi:hypothetical protein